ncbi:MAG: DUF58 domain-containing protein [Alphaproteobacteria bacterium]
MGIASALEKLRGRAESASLSVPALMMRSQKIAESILHGEHARRKPGTGNDFWQFREYIPTDRKEDIDWRQSAKGDQIYIKQKEWLVTRKIFFWCGGGKGMNFGSNPGAFLYTKQENAQVLSFALALVLRRSYEQIGVYGQRRTGRGELAMERLGQYLLERGGAPAADAGLPDIKGNLLPRHSIFIGIGDFLSPIEQIESCFASLAQQTHNALIVQVLDPAEIDLGFSGRVRFKGTRPEDEETIDNIIDVRKRYSMRMEEHIKSVEALCLRYNWHYHLYRTDRDIAEALISIREDAERGRVQL